MRSRYWIAIDRTDGELAAQDKREDSVDILGRLPARPGTQLVSHETVLFDAQVVVEREPMMCRRDHGPTKGAMSRNVPLREMSSVRGCVGRRLCDVYGSWRHGDHARCLEW